MATQDYYTWNSRGRPYRVATPIAELEAQMRAAGVQWLGTLGNEDHLQASNPEDHTPYSYTAWPEYLPDYIVCAVDGAEGKWCDRLLAAAKDGRAPWVKYMNFRYEHYSVKNGWVPTSSSDKHGHVSCRTDHLWTSLGGFNPFVDQQEEDVSLWLAKVKDSSAVWKGTGVHSTYVADEKTYKVLESNGARWLPEFDSEAAMFNAIGHQVSTDTGSGTSGELTVQDVEDAAFRGAQRAEKE